MAPNRSQVRETSISVSGVATTRQTEAAGAAGAPLNNGENSGPRMGASEPPMNLDLTSESDQEFSDFLRANNLIFLRLSKRAKLINHECITSKNSKFPYAKLENLCADIKKRVPTIHSDITKDFIWENVLVWLFAMQRSFEGLHDLKYDDKFNLILSEILAEYIHYKCNKFAKNDIANSKMVSNEILTKFCVLFERNHAYVLMTLLRINFRGCEFNERYASVLCPIFKKYLTKKFINQSTDFSYSRLILCFKKWKSLVHEAKQKEKINNIAMGDFNLEKYPTGVLPSQIPEKEEDQLLAIFPLYKQAKYLQKKYGRNAGTRTLLREDKSDLNKMISAYFKVFEASLKNEEDDIVWLMEELSTPLEPCQRRHQQKNSRTMRKGDNISDNDVIVLPDDDTENNVEKEPVVDNGARSSEGDSNNNKNNSVNSSEVEQKSYGAFSDISSGHEEDDLSRSKDCVPSSGTDQNGSLVKHSAQLLPSQSTTIFSTAPISKIPIPLDYHFPVVNGWSHTAETAISSTSTPSMFPNSPPNNTIFSSYHNPPNREVFVNDNLRSPEHTQQQIESDLCTISEKMFNKSILQNDQASKCGNLVNTSVNELNNSLGETMLKPNISASSDNLSDQVGDKPIDLPSKNVSNMSQKNSPIQCEKLKAIFMRRCRIDSNKTERGENKEIERDEQLNNVKETKTKSESITSGLMKPKNLFAQNSAQSIQNKKNEDLNNVSNENTLSTEIYDTVTIEPTLEAKVTSEKQLVPRKEPALAKELVPENEQGLGDYPRGNERTEDLNKLLFGRVRGSNEKESEKSTEDVVKKGSLSTDILDDPAAIKPILEVKQISEKQPVLQNSEESAKELVWDKKRVLKRDPICKQPIPQKEPVPIEESVQEKEPGLDDYPTGNERVDDLNKLVLGEVKVFKEKETEKNTEDITKEGSISTDILDDPATIKPILEATQISEQQPAVQNAEESEKELVWNKKRVVKRERVRLKQSTPQKQPVPAKEIVPEKEQGVDDYPTGSERAEDLSKPLFGRVRGSKEKETEKNTENIPNEGNLSTDILDHPATIKPILEVKQISEKQPTLQNAEGSAKELVCDKKGVLKRERIQEQPTPQKEPVSAKESVPEKEQGVDYPMGNERSEDLNKPVFGGVKGSKDKETEKSTEDIAKKGSLSTDIIDDSATIKPILEVKQISEKQPILQNAEGSAKELVCDKKGVLKRERIQEQPTPQKEPVSAKESVPEKEQGIDYPMGNERSEELNKALFGGVKGSKDKETEKSTEDVAKKGSLSTAILDDPATIKPILEIKQISEKQPILQNSEESAKELVWDKKRVLKRDPILNQSIPQKEPVPVKESVQEKEQTLDDYPTVSEIAEDLNKPVLGGIRGSKGKETEKNTEDITKERSISTDTLDDVATTKPILEAKQISEKQPAQQKGEGAKVLVCDKKRVLRSERIRKQSTPQKEPVLVKESVPEKEKGLDDYPTGNERVEDLSKPLFGRSRGSKEKQTGKSTEDITKEGSISTDTLDDVAATKPILEATQISEKQPAQQKAKGSEKELVCDKKGVLKRERIQKQPTPQKKPVPAKEIVPEKEQGLDDYPTGNERVEDLSKPVFGRSRGSKQKEIEKSTEDIPKEGSLSTDKLGDSTTIKPILEVKQIPEKQPAQQKAEGLVKELVCDKKRVLRSERIRKHPAPQKEPVSAKESVPEKEQGVDYPMGNERSEDLNKPVLGGVKGFKEKETEKSTKDVAKKGSLSTAILDDPATIKPILEVKQILEKQPILQNSEESARELVCDKKGVLKRGRIRKQSIPQNAPVPAKESVQEKEPGLDDYPMGNERVNDLNKPILGGIRGSKEKETEKNTEDITKERSISTHKLDDPATIKPILEVKQISEKQSTLQNAEGSAKELVWDKNRVLKRDPIPDQSIPQKEPVPIEESVQEKEPGLDDYPMGNERFDDLNKPVLGRVKGSKEKETEKNTEDITKEGSISTDTLDDVATTKPILEATQISEQQPALQNAEESEKELVWNKKRVVKRERVRLKQSTPQKQPVPAKEIVPEKEQGVDDYPTGSERAEDLSKPLFGRVRGSKEKETEKNTENIPNEGNLSTDILDHPATIKPILEVKQISEKQPTLQNAEGSAKELVCDKKGVLKRERIREQPTPQKEPVSAKESVPEKEQGVDYPMGNERSEELNKAVFGGVKGSKDKETEKSTEDVAKKESLSTGILDDPATIKPTLEVKQISEKQPTLQNAEGSAKELVCDKKRVLRSERIRKQSAPQKKPVSVKESVQEIEQGLDDYSTGIERVEDLSKRLFGRSSGSKQKEIEKSTEDIPKEGSLSTDKLGDLATIKPILEVEQIPEKQPAQQKAEGLVKELVCDKKGAVKRERIRKQPTPQKESVSAKESVPEKEQTLDDYRTVNEIAEDLSKPVFGGLGSSKEKETEKSTVDITKEGSLSTGKLGDPATIKPILKVKQISEKQPTLQNVEGSAKELVCDKKGVLKRERVRKQPNPHKEPVAAKESIPEKPQLLILFETKEIANNQSFLEKEAGLAKELTSETKNYTEIVKSAEAIKPLCDDNGNKKCETILQDIEVLTKPSVLKPQHEAGSKTKNIRRRRKSTTGPTKSKKQRIQAENDPASTLQDAKDVLKFQPKNNLQALKSMLVDEVEDTQDSQNSTDKTNNEAVREMITLTLNSDLDIIVSEAKINPNRIAHLVSKPLKKAITDEELIPTNFVYGPKNDPNLFCGEYLPIKNNFGRVITSEINYITKVKTLTQTQKPHVFNQKNENDVNLEPQTEQNKNLVQNSLENEAQRLERDCDIILMDKIDALLAPIESLNKITPAHDNLQNSQTPILENIENQDVLTEETKNDDILRSLKLKKVENITKPAECLNKPEESQVLKQQLKSITNKDCILKASVDEGRKSPTVLQEVEQEDIKSMQLLNVESKIHKLENEETPMVLDIFKTNSTNAIEEHFSIGVPSPQSTVDKADVALDIDDDSSSPSFSPLSNSSQIIDDDAKKSPFYEKENEIFENHNEIPMTSSCFLSNNEMTNILQNSDENLPASLIAQLDDKKPTIITNNEIFPLLSEFSNVPELDEEQTPIPLVSEIPKPVTPDDESEKFQNFNWTGQVDLYNIFDNVGDMDNNNSENLMKILELIDSNYTAAHLTNQGGRTGVKDVMCTPLLEATVTEKSVPNGTSSNFRVLFGPSSIVVTQKPCNGENSVIPGNDNTDEKNYVNEKNNIGRINSIDNNSYQSTPVQYTSAQPTFVQPTLVQSALVQPVLVQPSLVQPTSVKSTLVKPNLVQSTSAKSTLVQPSLVQTSLVQPTSAKSTLVNPNLVQPTSAKSTLVQPSLVQPTSAKSTLAQPTSAKSTLVQPSLVQPSLVQPISVKSTLVKPNLVQPTSAKSTLVQPTSVKSTLVNPNLVQPTSAKSTLVQPSLVQTSLVQPTSVKSTLVKPNLVQPISFKSHLVQPTFVQSTSAQSTSESFTTPVAPKTNQPIRGSLRIIPKNDKKSNDKNNIQTKLNDNSIDQNSVVDLSTYKHFAPHVLPTKPVDSLVPMQPVSTLTAAPLTIALQRRRNVNKIGTDKNKNEGKIVQEGKVVHGDLFEQVKNTPPPSQTLYKGNGTVTLRRKVGNNICSFEVKDGRKRHAEPFEFQPVTDAQLLEHLLDKKRRKLQS